MNLSNLATNALKVVKANSPEILTAAAVSGVVTTAYLAAKAAWASKDLLDNEDRDPHHDMTWQEKAKEVWPLYIPAAAAGAVTVTCIVGSGRGHARRTAAAVTAYTITEKAFQTYKEKVVEQMGVNKEQRMRDDIVQERVTNTQPTAREVVIVGGGNHLCCELHTGRFFRSDIETIRQVVNRINQRIITHVYVTLDEFYDELGLSHTSDSDLVGWDSDKLLEVHFTTTLSPSGEPCLAFDYNYTKLIT